MKNLLARVIVITCEVSEANKSQVRTSARAQEVIESMRHILDSLQEQMQEINHASSQANEMRSDMSRHFAEGQKQFESLQEMSGAIRGKIFN